QLADFAAKVSICLEKTAGNGAKIVGAEPAQNQGRLLELGYIIGFAEGFQLVGGLAHIFRHNRRTIFLHHPSPDELIVFQKLSANHLHIECRINDSLIFSLFAKSQLAAVNVQSVLILFSQEGVEVELLIKRRANMLVKQVV